MSDTYNDNTEDKPSLHIIYSWLSWNTAPHTSCDTSCDLSTLFISFQWAFLAGLVLLKSAPYYSVCVRVCVRERIKKKNHMYTSMSLSPSSSSAVKSTKLVYSQLTSFQHCLLCESWGGREREGETNVTLNRRQSDLWSLIGKLQLV